MPLSRSTIAALLSSSAIGLIGHGAAFAQAASGGQQLDEVVVTATRQTSTVNRVPLSITAQTQQTLDKQGIRNVSDLQKSVPGLNVSQAAGGVAQFAIRGISSSQGAATTGIYLDDTNLTKRNNVGTSANNGAPTPPLFDLERVEVLRGPQGTLYGGSSEGGTVRFITVQPSLTKMTGNARATVSALTHNGSPSYDLGVAVGGPIVQDKLGFRVSVFDQYTGGYINRVDPYNNFTRLAKDINWTDSNAFRGSLLWAPAEHATVSLGYYHSYVQDNATIAANGSIYKANGASYTVPATCYNTTRQFGGSPAPTAPVACPSNAIPGQTVNGIYQRPAQSYGPLAVGKYDTIDQVPLKTTTKLDVVPLTIGYDFGWMTVKSITSYIHDRTTSQGPGNTAEVANSQTTTAFPSAVGFLLYRPNPLYVGTVASTNERKGLTEELRFSSSADATRLTWVGGLYLSQYKATGNYCQARDVSGFTRQLFGLTTTQRFGTQDSPCGAERYQTLKDTEIAGFGEANYNITDKLKVIGGLRVSRTEFKFTQSFLGSLVGWNVPTVANSGLASGDVKETPVTPKLGVQYQLASDKMIYATAAKGYRVGGVNSPLSASICSTGLAALGLTVNDIPTTFNSDTVWSYEAGVKSRLLGGRVQVNASLYQIDWKDVQLTVAGFAAGCGQNYVANAGSARSRGVEFETQAQIFEGLRGSLAIGYTDAQYTQDSFGPRPLSGAAPVILVRKGDRFAVPKWTVNLGLEYNFTLAGYKPYVRADYSYQGDYVRTPAAGVSAYLPDSRNASAVQRLDLRAGVPINNWELNVFANNVLDSDDTTANGGGRSGCSIASGAACSTFTNYQPYLTVGVTRPREVGVQAMYRF